MSPITAERKETLLRRYGSKTINANAGPGGRRPGGFRGPGAPPIGIKGGKPKT